MDEEVIGGRVPGVGFPRDLDDELDGVLALLVSLLLEDIADLLVNFYQLG